VAVGHRAGISNTGSANVFIGALAGYSNTSSIGNVFIGGGVYGLTNPSGYLTTGGRNTFVGAASGHLVTSGAKNTILGNFDGNQGGLDIRTADNYIVLSDGDGNPRLFMNSTGAGRVTSGNFSVGADPYAIGYGPQFFFGDGAGGAMGMLNAQSINTNDYPVVLTANAYCTGVNTFAYVTSSANASRIRMNQGAVNFAGADTGTAGSAITFTEILSVKKDETLALQGAGRYSGTGITFPATQSASSDANTLDDYEEGAWTPTTSAGGVTVTNLNSYYTKIGRLVHVYAYVEVNNSGGTLGGIAWTGLPFAALSYAPALRYYKAGTGSASTQIWAADTYTESGSAQIIDNNDIGSGVSQIMISATYFVA
jgi:hypothetical protein